MKKAIVHPVFLLILMITMLVCSSCEKEGDIHENDLIGTWDIGQASVDIKVGPVSIIPFLRTTLMLSEQEAQEYVDDFISEYDYISGGTITFNLDYSYLILNGEFEEQGTWELQGDELSLTNTDQVLEDTPLKIENLSSSSALMTWEEDQEVDMDENGSTDFTATIIIEVNLSKQ